MRPLEAKFSSFQVNAALALVLDIVLVLFGQHIYCEFINASCRRKLLAGQNVPVSGQERKYSFVVFSFLVLIIGIAIELGFEGQSIGALYTVVRPLKSAMLTRPANWTVDERWDVNIADVSLEDFEPAQQRKGCFQTGKSRLTFPIYGTEGCYRLLPLTGSANNLGSNVKFVDMSLNSEKYTVQLGEVLDEKLSRDRGVLTFRNGNDSLEQLSVRFSAIVERPDSQSNPDGSTGRMEGTATFSILRDWQYSDNGEQLESIFMLFQGDGKIGRLFFQVFHFSDVFSPTRLEDDTDVLTPRFPSQILNLFEIETYSMVEEGRLSDTRAAESNVPRVEIVEDLPELAAAKVYHALSKLHFFMGKQSNKSLSFGFHMMSSIDERLSSESAPEVNVKIPLADSNITEIELYAVVCLASSVAVLILVKLYFLILRRSAPISVQVFDLRYISMLRVSHKQMKRMYCKPGYDVLLKLEEGRRPTLNLRDYRQHGTEASFSTLTTKS